MFPKISASRILCNRENYTFFDNGELEKFTCGAFFGWRYERNYTGVYTLIENELTICIERGDELECEGYNCRFTDRQMRLEREVKDGCTEVSVYMR